MQLNVTEKLIRHSAEGQSADGRGHLWFESAINAVFICGSPISIHLKGVRGGWMYSLTWLLSFTTNSNGQIEKSKAILWCWEEEDFGLYWFTRSRWGQLSYPFRLSSNSSRMTIIRERQGCCWDEVASKTTRLLLNSLSNQQIRGKKLLPVPHHSVRKTPVDKNGLKWSPFAHELQKGHYPIAYI